MFGNALKVSFRKLLTQKQFSLINIIGLSTAMAAALAIFYYVSFERSYEDFNPRAAEIHRFIMTRTTGEGTQELVNVPPTMMDRLVAYEEIEDAARFYNVDYQNSSFLSEEDGIQRSFHVDGVYYAEGNFAEITGLPIAAGSSEAFNQPKSAAITQALANKLYPGVDPIGKTMRIVNNVVEYEVMVRMVLEDLPENTDFPFNVLLSISTLPMTEGSSGLTDENAWRFQTYVGVKPGVAVASLSDEVMNGLVEFQGDPDAEWGVELIPVKEMHFKPYAMSSQGNKRDLWALAIIGIFIMVLAWINYMNLSTTRALERAREVGVRKVLGAGNNHVRIQFFGEALILNGIAALLAFTIVQASRPLLAEIGNPMVISESQIPVFVLGCLAFILTGTLLSGLYPSFIITRHQLVDVMAGSFKSGKSGSVVRRVLVIAQFSISVILMIGTYVIYDQISYMKNLELGMEIEDMLVLQAPPGKLGDEKFQSNTQAFKESLLNQAGIATVSGTSSIPGEVISWGESKIMRSGAPESDVIEMKNLIAMDRQYFEALGIDLVAGRFYNENDNTFARGDIIINEKALETFGFESAEEAIGGKLTGGGIFPEMTIAGVVENSHHLSPRNAYQPTLYVLSIWANYYLIKLNLPDADPESRLAAIRSSLDTMEELWQTNFPEAAFDYSFLDERFDAQYKQDERFSRLFSLFAMVAIFIAVLGLFGLSAYDVFQRTKEIGIRKVMGASNMSIITRLTRHYVTLVAISGLAAIPISIWGAIQWHESFAFHSSLSPIIFMVPVIIVLFLAAAVVITQVVRVAQKNPVETLKYE